MSLSSTSTVPRFPISPLKPDISQISPCFGLAFSRSHQLRRWKVVCAAPKDRNQTNNSLVGKNNKKLENPIEEALAVAFTNLYDGIYGLLEAVFFPATSAQQPFSGGMRIVDPREIMHEVEDMAEKGEEMAREMAEEGQEMAKEMAEEGQEMAKEMAEKGEEMAKEMAEKGEEMAKEMAEKGEEMAKEMAEKGGLKNVVAGLEQLNGEAGSLNNTLKLLGWMTGFVERVTASFPVRSKNGKEDGEEQK